MQQKKNFRHATYGIIAFMAVALLAIGASFNGEFLGVKLGPFLTVFAALEFAILAFTAYTILQDEKHADAPTSP